MAGEFNNALQVVATAYNTVESERNKVSKLKTDYYYLKDNSPRLRLIMRVVQDKVNKKVANQWERQWLESANVLNRDLVSFLGELDRKLKIGGEGQWWDAVLRWWHTSLGDLGRRTSRRQQRLQRQLEETCAQEIEKSISLIDLARTTPVIPLLVGHHTVSFTARNSDQFWTQFENQNVQVIGIHGMIGIGKSTFLKKINDSFCENHRGYDMVIFVPPSSNSNLKEEVQRIQDEIAKRLWLTVPEQWRTLPNESEIRPTLLRQSLSGINVLLLLDNLLDGVTLSSLGIPIPTPNLAPAPAPPALPAVDPTTAPDYQPKFCKLVFTARRKFTGSNIGAPVHEIELDLLDKDEARKLFKFKARQHHPNPLTSMTEGMENLADKIADMCGGLPLALDKIGDNFQSKSRLEEWKTQIDRLGRPERASDRFPEGQVYACLKEAYNSLKDGQPEDDYPEKDCFLHCSLFPEGHAIEENELKCHWIGEELLGKVRRKMTFHDYFNCAVSIIEELKRAHLLSSSSDDQYSVKLHCQFHRMARWIQERGFQEKIFRQSDGKLDELSTMMEECEEQVKWISLMNCVGNLKRIDRPDLSTLVMRHSVVTKIEEDLFASIQGSLKVLDLATCSLPVFQLNAVEMSNLEYLNLSHTKITCLPFDLKKLSKLKFLDLSFTENLIVKELKSLSTLSDLQLLNLYYFGPCGSLEKSQGGGAWILLKYVEKLNHLSDLAITIRGNVTFQELKKFSKLNLTRSMVITNCHDIQLNLQVIATAEKLGVIHVINCSATLHLAQDTISRGTCFENLSDVKIDNCRNLADLTWIKYAQALQSLKIARCSQLTEVIIPPTETQPGQLPFDKLKTLELSDLRELRTIFCKDLPFSSLESIIVRNCAQLEPIPIADNKDRKMRPVIKCHKIWWEGIKDNARKSRLRPEFI